MERISHGVPLHYIETTRIPQYLQLYKYSTERLAHFVAFFSIDITGIHIEDQTLVALTITDQTMAGLAVTNQVLSALSITSETLATILIEEQKLYKLTIEDQELN